MARSVLPLIATALLLAACGNDTELPGRGYLPPSEVTRSQAVPLTVPPGFGLRPGDTAEHTASGGTIVASAEQPATVEVAALDATVGEQQLMVSAGVLEANPNIRRILNRENALLVGDPVLVDTLLFGSFPKSVSGESTTQETPAIEIEEGQDVAPDVAIEQSEPVEDGTWVDSVIDLF